MKKPAKRTKLKSPRSARKTAVRARVVKPRKPRTRTAKKSPNPLPVKEIQVQQFSQPREEPKGFQLPSRYGVDRLVLLVRDPWWLYAYWELTPEKERAVWDQLRRDGQTEGRAVLRIYDVTDAPIGNDSPHFDIEVAHFADNWYVDVGVPDREWMAELGVRTPGGSFYALLRSNRVRTPRYGVSDVIDEEWMMPDDLYWKLLGRSGGLWDAKSSLDVKRYLMRYLKSNLSSEAARSKPLAPAGPPVNA